jgi:hypothetical protein
MRLNRKILMLTLIVAVAFAPRAGAQRPDPCPVVLGVDKSGNHFTNRFHGWYRVSSHALTSDLKGGCYNDAQPAAVSSVTLYLAVGVPSPQRRQILSILRGAGWSERKIMIRTWTNPPHQPSVR